MFAVAEAVGRPVYEIEERMPLEELIEWSIFWTIRREHEEAERKKLEAKSRADRGRRGGR